MNVVITGSTRGIGYGLAEEFIKAGHGVLINGRDRMICGEVYNRLRFKYPECLIHLYACDVTCYNSLDRMFWEANRYFGSVDIWINNAGVNLENRAFYTYDKRELDHIIDINIKGMIYGTKVATERMKDSGGYIYNMEGFGSNNQIVDKMTYYGMTKKALTYFTKSASKEVKNTDVKIGTLNPGVVITDMLKSGIPVDEKERQKTVKIFNTLADKVETVAPYLVKKVVQNKKNGASIKWLNSRKIVWRFFLALFHKRELLNTH